MIHSIQNMNTQYTKITTHFIHSTVGGGGGVQPLGEGGVEGLGEELGGKLLLHSLLR